MLNDIFILDRNKLVVATLSLKGSNPFFDFSYKEYLETGANTFDFSVVLDDELAQYVIEKNFVLFERNGKLKLFQIMTCVDEESYDNVIRTVQSETIGLELANDYVRATTIEGNMETFLKTILMDTNYKVGEVSETLSNEVRTTIISEPTSVYQLIQDAVATYNNVEFEFDVKCNNSVTGDYDLLINCYADGERGSKKYRRFDYDFNAYGMSRTGDATEFCSGLIGVGANGITFKDIEWRYPIDPLDKPKGQDFLLDQEAHEMFSNGDKYILGKYSSNATNPSDLLWETYHKLQEVKQVKYDYEIPVYLTDEEFDDIDIGDTNYICNDKFNPPLQLEARIVEFEITDTESTLKFSNYKNVKSNIQDLDNDSLVTKLSESEVIALQQYLAQLDINQAEIDKIIKDLVENIDDIVDIVNNPQPPVDTEEEIVPVDDEENYKTIKLSKTDGGLFLGDKRIYDIKKQGVANITVEKKETITEETTVTISSSKSSQQYKDALEYYEKFRLGSKKNDSTLAKVMSSSNKYKIPVLVRYWSDKFGLDTRLVYAMIVAESSGNPKCATKSSGGGYGLMQCERSCYFNKKQTIKFVDGTTRSFTPSYNTMNPDNGITTTINGVKVNQNISNQIMFGCHELRKCAEACHYNVFATLMAYNFGQAGMQWCVCEYIKDKYGYSVNSNKRGISSQSSKVKEKYYDILDTYKAPFASYRKKYKAKWNAGTPTNIEYYLRYYKPNNGSLPFFKDKNGKKIGYGVVVPSGGVETRDNTGSEVRDIIVKIAKEIVSQHKDDKKATYNQRPRTVNFDKPVIWSGTHYGIKNPIAYDCSSFVSCCYLKAGLNSVYNKACSDGTLVKSATSKRGWKAWKLTTSNLDNYAKAGDIIMVANSTVSDSKVQSNPNQYSTHHTIIYCGKVNGKHMIAHASKWAYHPEAIRYETADWYINGGKSFILRPWDLAKADTKILPSESTGDTSETIINTKEVIKKVTVSEVTLKGLPNATTDDYNDLPSYGLVINNIEDNIKFPKTAPFVFCHFGVGDLNTNTYISLLRALQNKYPKKPIFVAKEYHVNSSYADANAINTQIDTFNAIMKNYCNETKYVIFIDVSKGLVDSNGAILTDLSSDGYSFKDKASVKKYYDNVKKYILNIAKGQTISSSSITVTLTAQTQKIHKYDKPVKSFTLKLPTTAEDEFYSRIIFTTDSSSIKFVQPSTLYMAGDNCKKGAFTPKKANKYTINIFKNVDTELTNKKYYASVTSLYTSTTVRKEGYVNTPGTTLNVRTGSSTKYKILGKLKDNTKITIISKTSNNWYKIKYKTGYGYVSGKYVDNVKDVTDTTTNFTNYKNFKYRDKLVKNAETFLAKKDRFVYNNKCAFDFSNPSENIDSWKTGDKYHIDDNFLMQLLVMGYEYDTCDLANKTSRAKATGVSWALPYISSESKLLRYFVERDWILDDVDMINFSNIEPGDILFWDSDDANNNEFMACSHTSICVGKINGVNYIIEGQNGDYAIRKIKITDRNTNNLLCVGRINLDK